MSKLNVNYFFKQGYLMARQLNDGTWIGLHQYIYTAGLCYGLDEFGMEGRYCFETMSEAIPSFLAWTGDGDPPGLWIKQKPSNRMNPAWLQALKKTDVVSLTKVRSYLNGKEDKEKK